MTNLYLTNWTADYLDPHSFLNVAVHLYVPWWRNADYEYLLDVAQHITDPLERIKVYQNAERILIHEAPIMPLTYWRSHILIKSWVKRYPISPLDTNYWKDVIIEAH